MIHLSTSQNVEFCLTVVVFSVLIDYIRLVLKNFYTGIFNNYSMTQYQNL